MAPKARARWGRTMLVGFNGLIPGFCSVCIYLGIESGRLLHILALGMGDWVWAESGLNAHPHSFGVTNAAISDREFTCRFHLKRLYILSQDGVLRTLFMLEFRTMLCNALYQSLVRSPAYFHAVHHVSCPHLFTHRPLPRISKRPSVTNSPGVSGCSLQNTTNLSSSILDSRVLGL